MIPADQTVCIQTALTAVGGIALPRGDLVVTDTVRAAAAYGPAVTGAGAWKTTIIWRGPPDRPLFDFEGCWGGRFGGFRVLCETPLLCGFRLRSKAGGTVPSTAFRFDDVWLEGVNGRLGTGWVVDGPDQNNDYHRWVGCQASNYTDAAWDVNGQNAHCLHWDNCLAAANGLGKYGWRGRVWGYGSWANWCGANACTEADFWFDNPQTRILIDKYNGENSRRLFWAGGPSGSVMPVSLSNVRWAGKPGGEPVITYQNPGPLVLDGLDLMDVEHLTPPTIRLTSYEAGSLTARNLITPHVSPPIRFELSPAWAARYRDDGSYRLPGGGV
jgi:hypothetical protein